MALCRLVWKLGWIQAVQAVGTEQVFNEDGILHGALTHHRHVPTGSHRSLRTEDQLARPRRGGQKCQRTLAIFWCTSSGASRNSAAGSAMPELINQTAERSGTRAKALLTSAEPFESTATDDLKSGVWIKT